MFFTDQQSIGFLDFLLTSVENYSFRGFQRFEVDLEVFGEKNSVLEVFRGRVGTLKMAFSFRKNCLVLQQKMPLFFQQKMSFLLEKIASSYRKNCLFFQKKKPFLFKKLSFSLSKNYLFLQQNLPFPVAKMAFLFKKNCVFLKEKIASSFTKIHTRCHIRHDVHMP